MRKNLFQSETEMQKASKKLIYWLEYVFMNRYYKSTDPSLVHVTRQHVEELFWF